MHRFTQHANRSTPNNAILTLLIRPTYLLMTHISEPRYRALETHYFDFNLICFSNIIVPQFLAYLILMAGLHYTDKL